MADDTPYKLYARKRGKNGRLRWYAHFSKKDFNETFRRMALARGDTKRAQRKNLCRVPLVPKGGSVATDDKELAKKLAANILEDLRDFQRKHADGDNLIERISLEDLTARYLAHKTRQRKEGIGKPFSERWLTQTRNHLNTAVDFFGPRTDVTKINVDHVRNYLSALRRKSNGRGGTISSQTQRHYLNSLSKLFKHAQSRRYAPSGYNPVANLESDEMPSPSKASQAWLEFREAALFLEAARLWTPDADAHAVSFIVPLLATFLYTGGRKSEIFGLTGADVSFDDKVIHIRENKWRSIKTEASDRKTKLWSQLEVILREHIFTDTNPPGDDELLFPSPRTGKMLDNVDKALDRIAELSGLGRKVRLHMLRHTYISIRIQTLHFGHPVSLWQVAREVGHSSTNMIERRYGHLAEHPIRMEGMDLRMDRWLEALRKTAEDERAHSKEADDMHALLANSFDERADRDERWWREKIANVRAKAGSGKTVDTAASETVSTT